jgi:DNA repair photolyase
MQSSNDNAVRVHEYGRKQGITRTEEFEKKGLATHAVNVGFRCGHSCTYCSTASVYRQQPVFKEVGEHPFELGYAIVDPNIAERVAYDAKHMQKRGLVQLCTTVDAWSPEAQAHDLGRRCLEAILQEPGWTVRILTKNAAVTRDFDIVEQHRDRVLVGLSLTGTPDMSGPVSALEPHASSIEERVAALEEAHRRGLRTFGMFCPLFPGISDSKTHVDWLVQFGKRIGVEEIFVESLNGRAKALPHSINALREAGYPDLAVRMDAIRREKCWSNYTRELISTAQASIREHSDISKFRFLLYPGDLTENDAQQIRQSDDGVVWLGKSAEAAS